MSSVALFETNVQPEVASNKLVPDKMVKKTYTWNIAWTFVLFFIYIHCAMARGLHMFFTGRLLWYTILWNVAVYVAGNLSITGGAHRLWAHRSYKAKLPLRILLMMMNNLQFQGSIYRWARDHRMHHKFVDTDADPYNMKRGFFFAHIGWLLIRKHPVLLEKSSTMDISDLQRDPVVMFQHKHYLSLCTFFAFIMPTVVPIFIWGENVWAAWYCGLARLTLIHNAASCINSVAHSFGSRPYDTTITPTNNALTAFISMGEGWHNYHHVFPWDYKTDELSSFFGNFTAVFIDLMERIGWAFDLKTVPKEMVEKRMRRTGDGSHPRAKLVGDCFETKHCDSGAPLWGWGDTDMLQEDKLFAGVGNKAKKHRQPIGFSS